MSLEAVGNMLYPEALFGGARKLPKPISVGVAMISGIVKTVTFPLWAALGFIGFLVKGVVELVRGDYEKASLSFGASLICFGLFAAFGLFLYVSAFHLPILGASSIFLGFVTIAITVHVVRAWNQIYSEPVTTR